MIDERNHLVDEEEAEARLLAAQVPGLGAARMQRLLTRYGAVRVALQADVRELEGVLGAGLGRQLAHGEALRRRWRACEGALARLGARVVARGQPDYPDGLYDLCPPPSAVYYQGRLPQRTGVAIVGTRTASKAACDKAARFAAAVVEAGLPVVSGGAYGIDAGAHTGALDSGGTTVVVFGGGLDRPYPDRHIALFERAARQGCLLSPFRPGTPPLRGGFLARNAIIAALCNIVVVVNAGWRSGARSTALAARQLGRRIFVVPGSPGCDRLLAEGATAMRRGRDMKGLLSGNVTDSGSGEGGSDGFDNLKPVLLPEGDLAAREVLAALDAAGSTSEAVARRTGLEPGQVLAALMAMVLDGRVAQRPGGRFYQTNGQTPVHDTEGSR